VGNTQSGEYLEVCVERVEAEVDAIAEQLEELHLSANQLFE
jgi:hypothetical protein